MSKLDSFFSMPAATYHHPLLRFLEMNKPDRVSVDVVRPKDVLGYKSAKLFLNWTKNDLEQPPVEYGWDDELNGALIQRGIRAVSPDAEKVRFGLVLRHAFKRPESRFGDGFFNSVLAIVVRESGFPDFPEVAGILKQVSTNQPHMEGNWYPDCRQMIEGILGAQATELVSSLQYSQDDAKSILAGAVARYLDERFSVTDRIRWGWTGQESARGQV